MSSRRCIATRLSVTTLAALLFAACSPALELRAPEPSPTPAIVSALLVPDSCAYVPEQGGYLFCKGPASFEAAEKLCLAADMELVSIDDKHENEFVAGHAAPGSYLGLSDRDADGVWRWQADGRTIWCAEPTSGRLDHPTAFAAWSNVGEPKRGTKKPDPNDCAVIDKGGAWLSTDCGTPRGFVCEGAKKSSLLTFAHVTAGPVRDDYRTGKRRISHASFTGGLSAPEIFARYTEDFGLRRCVDSFAEVGAPRPTPDGAVVEGYEQTYRGIPVHTRGYHVTRDAVTGHARSMTGRVTHDLQVDLTISVDEGLAYEKALGVIDASDVPYRPKPRGRLVVFPVGGGPKPIWRLAWLFSFPHVDKQDAYAVAIATDTPDVLMVSGEKRAQCAAVDIPASVPVTEAAATVHAFQQDPPFSDPDALALSRLPDGAAHPYALYRPAGELVDPSGLRIAAPRMFAACPNEDLPRVAALDTPNVSVTGESPDAPQLAALLMAAQRSLVTNAATFTTSAGTPWIGLDGRGSWDLGLYLLSSAEAAEYRFTAFFAPDTRTLHFARAQDGPPFVGAAPDLVGHEIGHAIAASFTGTFSGYGSDAESRAIDEGFADLLGELTDIRLRGADHPSAFCHGGDELGLTSCYRNMRYPAASADSECIVYDRDGTTAHGFCPGDYRGPDFCTLPFCDFQEPGCCGPHRNSTILSHWFTLVSMGSAGTTGAGCRVSVAPLDPNPQVAAGMAARLVFEALRDGSFAPATGFEGLADATIDRAIATFSADSPQARSVVDAWFAVNVKQESFFEPDAASVSPAREAVGVYPWSTFTFPWHPGETRWDIQISTGGFVPGSIVFEDYNVGRFRVVDDRPVGAISVSLPHLSNQRYFWRVRPQSTETWLDCDPIHSFVGTGRPGDATIQGIRQENDEGQVYPGSVHIDFDRVPGAKRYRVHVATRDPNCMGGDGVHETTRDADVDDDDFSVAKITATVGPLLPGEHYFVSVQPIGPDDEHRHPRLGSCSKAEFDTADMRAPILESPADGEAFVDLGDREVLRFRPQDGPADYRVRFFELDEHGNCEADIAHVQEVPREAAPRVGATELRGVDVVPLNLTGYCWDVIAIAENGRESAPSERRYFRYFHPALGLLTPGVSLYEARRAHPGPLPGDSYGTPVSLAWLPDEAAAAYEVQLGRWPWGAPVSPRDPERCTGRGASWSCDQGPAAETYRDVVTNSVVDVPGEHASRGRYCWRAWPLLEDPHAPGTLGARQPLLDAGAVYCYTSGPARPEIIIDDPGDTTVSGLNENSVPPPPREYSGRPARGRIRLPYVPDAQYEISHNSDRHFEIGSACAPDPNATPYADVYECEVPFTLRTDPRSGYFLRVRTWNSGATAASMRDESTQVHDEFLWFGTGPCGHVDQYCCEGRTCLDPSTVCVRGASTHGDCLACGRSGQHCCDGGSCEAGTVCAGGSCTTCGGPGQPCCAGSTCNGGSLCDGGTCAACGGSGQRCCAGNTCSAGATCSGGTCSSALPCNSSAVVVRENVTSLTTWRVALPGPRGTIELHFDSDAIPVQLELNCEGSPGLTTGCCATDGTRCGGWDYCLEDGNCVTEQHYDCPSQILNVTANPSCSGVTNSSWRFLLSCHL